MANLIVKTNVSGNDAAVILHRGGATNWRMRASGGNYWLEHQINNSGDWNVSMKINELTQGNNIVVTGSITASSFIGNASSATNADMLDNLHAASFLQCAGGQTLTGVLHLSSTAAINTSGTSTILSYNNASCTNAAEGTCVGAPNNITTIRGTYLYHATDSGIYSILTSNNYTLYTVSKTGSGASGTWGISISGNSATATFSGLSLGSADANRFVIFQDSNNYTDKLAACYNTNFQYNPVSGYLFVPKLSYGTSNVSGHLYLTGASANSSTSNTSQIVFGTSSNNHVCISSNTNCLIINPSLNDTSGQVALYTNQQSKFPNGINAGSSYMSSASIPTLSVTTITASSQIIGTLFLDNNGTYTAYGSLPPEGHITGILGRVYFQTSS